jgi:hypothetical protein
MRHMDAFGAAGVAVLRPYKTIAACARGADGRRGAKDMRKGPTLKNRGWSTRQSRGARWRTLQNGRDGGGPTSEHSSERN